MLQGGRGEEETVGGGGGGRDGGGNTTVEPASQVKRRHQVLPTRGRHPDRIF